MNYRFTKHITVNGVAYAEGETVGEDDIAPGYFGPLKRLRQVVPDVETPIDLAAVASESASEPEAEPDTETHQNKHKKRHR